MINSGDLWRLFPMAPSRLIEFAADADPMYAWLVESVPACVLGLTPTTFDFGAAYIWGWNTPLVEAHRMAYALNVRRLLKEQLKRWPLLLGHCTEAKRRWIESFGGEVYGTFGKMLTFKIEAHS